MKSLIYIVFLTFSFISYSQDGLVNFGNFRMHTNAKLGIYGDLTNNGSFSNNLGEVHLTGSSTQNISGNNFIQTNNLILNNLSNVKLDNELQVSSLMTFTNGILITDRSDNSSEFLHFLPGSSHSNASSLSYTDGVVRKTGNTRFEFPVGENGLYRYIEISAPASLTDNFTTYYNNSDPHIGGYNHGSKEPIIDHISNCEYWILDRTNGSSNVSVTLSYDNLGTAGCSGVTNQSDLLITRWDGTMWKNHGNSSTTGSPSAGSVTTFGNVTSFSPFTLASTTTNNPLPVELLEFNAIKDNENVLVYWSTASEINSNYFIIQKTEDLNNWKDVTHVDAQGISNIEVQYSDYDFSPYNSVSYYRLKQVDLDGAYTFSNIAMVNFNQNSELSYNIYPNPTSNVINVSFQEKKNYKVTLSNSIGQNINLTPISIFSAEKITVNTTELAKGIYYLTISNKESLLYNLEKIIIQ